MRKLSVFVLFLLSLTLAAPAMSAVQFYDDCEDYPNLNGDWGLTQTSGKLSVSSEQKRAGNKSYKMEFNAGITVPTETGMRVELKLNGPFARFEFNHEYWVGYSIYIPSNFTMPSGWACIGQWHKTVEGTECDQAPRPANPAVAQPFMNFLDGTDAAPKMQVQITGQSQRCQPYGYDYRKSFYSPVFKKGGWNDIVIHTIFRYDAKGITEMWMNGTKFISINEINAHNDPYPNYLKLGFYGSSNKNHVVYYDEIRVAGAGSSYSEVAPKGTPVNPATIEPPLLKVFSRN